MTRLLDRIETLSPDERRKFERALRARARMQRKIANGIKLCGAKTRQGRPCVATALRNGRCKNHGGVVATGEARERMLAGGRKGRQISADRCRKQAQGAGEGRTS